MIRNSLRCLLLFVLAGTIMAAPALLAHSHVDKHQGRQQLRLQRQRIHRTRRGLHANARQSDRHSAQARVTRHHLMKVQRHDLRHNRKQAHRLHQVRRHVG